MPMQSLVTRENTYIVDDCFHREETWGPEVCELGLNEHMAAASSLTSVLTANSMPFDNYRAL